MVGGKCNEDQCLAEIGGALGADFMVSGQGHQARQLP